MIPVEIYSNVYYLLLSITVLFSILPLFIKKDLECFPKINLYVGTFLVLLIVIAFIGLRDPYGNWKYFGDTNHYSEMYKNLSLTSYGVKSDFGFYFLMLSVKPFLDIVGFYFICALIYVLLPYYTFKKWFKEYVFFALLLYVTSMSFWAFGINGVRNGLASSVFIFALSFYDKKWLMYGIILISISFHKSMFLPLIAFILTSEVKDTKFLIKMWLSVVVISYFFGSQIETLISDFFLNSGIFDDRRVETYFSDEIDGEAVRRSYRIDFILYSAVAIVLGYYYKYKKQFESVFYNRLLNTYIIANLVWVFLIYAAYTNRTAYLSWFIMPVVMIYPLLKQKIFDNQTKVIGFMIVGSLLFTLLIYFKTA
ncbi:EpsG family protein [Flavobacterium sp. N2270]|uniref:EpsG family protein n=1 Tax=Flavobacterium sp. N2270 TaxID=2986831 RepID=UPI00222413C4|nr:EpsG family protein [Flavobacterium sp. N2270]